MKPHSLKIIKKINDLYKTSNQKEIKLAFDFFEKTDWTLREIINFVLKNHKTQTFDNRIKTTNTRKFHLGSVYFDFTVIEDWEALDDSTDYRLELYLSLINNDNEIIKSASIKNIQTESIFEPFWGTDEDDVLSFTAKMDECLDKVFENIDISKTKNLYSYIFNFFSEFIDKLNNKEVILYEEQY